MHPVFGIPGIHEQQQQQQELDNMSMNHTHNNNNIVEQVIHHNLFIDHHNSNNHQQQQPQHPFLPISYMSAEGAGAPSAYYPVNFKLGLNEINCTSSSNERDGVGKYNSASINGSEHYQDETRHTSLEMHNQHCWPQDSSSIIKQTQQFWEHHPVEVSNGNSEIIDKLEKMNQKLPYQRCSSSKASQGFGELGELEAVYKRCGTSTVNRTPDEVLPRGQDQGSDGASIDASVCLKDEDNQKKMKKKKRKGRASCNELVEFFEKLVKQVVDHQENLYTKFVERMERLDAERKEKEEAWRSRELVHFEQQAATRARENALAATRDGAIVSYLEKITGQSVPSFPSFNNPSS